MAQVKKENVEAVEQAVEELVADAAEKDVAVEPVVEEPKVEVASSEFKFFKTPIFGLEIYLNADVLEQSKIKKVSFKKVRYTNAKDDKITIGLLKTDNARVFEILESDPNVTEISESDYEELLNS